MMSHHEDTAIAGARIAGRTEQGAVHTRSGPTASDARPAGWVGTDAVDRAVAAAVEARASWASTSAVDRAAALTAIATELRSRTTELADIIARESGKRAAEAEAEVEFSARYFDWFAEAAVAAESESSLERPGRMFRVRRHPVGVVAAVATWNFPLSIPARKIAAAVAAGCPTILKASERTPECADRLVELCERHLPVGVIGSVMGDGKALVPALVEHPDVAAVTFTGSSAIGADVGRRAGATHTRAVLELGGRAPFIVREDADLDEAIEVLLVAKLRNNGQSCIAANNVFVHSSVHDAFVSRLAERVRAVRPGEPSDQDADFGPLIDAEAVERLEALIVAADAEGARTTRGQVGTTSTMMAAALVQCPDDSDLWNEEIFGPVFAIRSFESEDDVVAEVNAWGVGLAGYVCGTDDDATSALAARLRIGIVGVNNGAPNTPEVPFGGFGASGIGREGAMSGMFAFTEEQTISIAR